MRRVILLAIIASLHSCTLFQGSDLEESYIHFKEPIVTTLLEQGEPTHNIKDLWIEMDGFNLGVWPVDRTVPFLPENETASVFIFPGIKNNGAQSDGVIYPFFNPIAMSKSFEPQAVDTMVLEFEYSDITRFSFVEDFEGAQLFTKDEDDDDDSSIFIESIDGNKVGVLNPHSETPTINVSTSLVFSDIPLDGRAVYLELEYKTDIEFVIGIIGVDENGEEAGSPKIIIRPKADWNKIYIDFSLEVSQSKLEGYRIFFASQNEGNDIENQKIYIDNVKLVHF